MPKWSEERQMNLLTVEECAVATGKAPKTIMRRLKNPLVYREYHFEKAKVGAVKTTYIDPYTLGLSFRAEGHVHSQESGRTLPKDIGIAAEGHAVLALPEREQAPILDLSIGSGERTSTLSIRNEPPEALALSLTSLSTEALALHQRLQPLLRTKRNSTYRRDAVAALAAEMEVSDKTIYRWLTALETQANSPYAITRQQRADKGKLRIPAEIRELITAAYLNNKPNVSARAIHRALMRSVPEMMQYTTKSGTIKRIEPWTVLAVEKELRADPVMQLIFHNGKERKEFLRVYNGKVKALHANAQWEMDMTRCDVEVFNPITRRFYRLRVHAIIDVYSTCITGLAFSEDEDQAQTNIALLRALTQKQGRYGHMYPIWGTPNSIYWDNGKTYRSNEVDRIVETLGITSIHSTPRVSHTRGAIERFFGTFHGMLEKALTGYVGMNAVDRDSEELRKLRERTLRWVDTGIDPGRQNRHLTEEEFKSLSLMWLLTEYHQMRGNDGLTRQERFLQSIATEEGKQTLKFYDPAHLYLTFCRHEERTVTPDAGIRYANTLLKSPTGALAGYAGRKVILLHDSFSTEGAFGVVVKQIDNTYRVLGEVEAAPLWADSEAAAQTRQVTKGALKELLNNHSALEQQARHLYPETNIAESLVRALPPADPQDLPVIDVTPKPTRRARLTTEVRQDDVGNFGFGHITAEVQTAEELMAALDNAIPRRKK